jgi:hypothetical protein
VIETLLFGLLGIYVALNLFTMWRIARDPLSERGQKIAQIGFIWCIPLLGAAAVLHLQRQEPTRDQYDPNKPSHAVDVPGLNHRDAVAPGGET